MTPASAPSQERMFYSTRLMSHWQAGPQIEKGPGAQASPDRATKRSKGATAITPPGAEAVDEATDMLNVGRAHR